MIELVVSEKTTVQVSTAHAALTAVMHTYLYIYTQLYQHIRSLVNKY